MTIIDVAINDSNIKHLAISDMELTQLITGLGEILIQRTKVLDTNYTEGRLQDMQTCVFLIGKCHQLLNQENDAEL